MLQAPTLETHIVKAPILEINMFDGIVCVLLQRHAHARSISVNLTSSNDTDRWQLMQQNHAAVNGSHQIRLKESLEDRKILQPFYNLDQSCTDMHRSRQR